MARGKSVTETGTKVEFICPPIGEQRVASAGQFFSGKSKRIYITQQKFYWVWPKSLENVAEYFKDSQTK